MLTKEQIIQTLQRHHAELKPFGIKKLSLFGSTARGDNHSQSDLDFVVEFEQKSFDAYMGLKDYLETLFNCRVDLVLPNTIKPRLRTAILNELVDAA